MNELDRLREENAMLRAHITELEVVTENLQIHECSDGSVYIIFDTNDEEISYEWYHKVKRGGREGENPPVPGKGHLVTFVNPAVVHSRHFELHGHEPRWGSGGRHGGRWCDVCKGWRDPKPGETVKNITKETRM